ncbi:ARM repeat-containing protein [Plenodomus tracheiphilus IPT5]|uniref:ARM repeat-containing protein n=1 Tax=Plenodomus tracheiphilus IPT5 TaxID=1408161 RepID=A0A6A7BIL0_9PLEO|nr:ARM repeat-containing protein [Plenodomus tracheiphilus IPT5]
MELIDLQSRRGEEEINRLSTEVRYGKPAHSQPTTPPEYNEGNGFPTAFSRPNRFSMSSINSGMITGRGSRANSQVTSPPSNFQSNGGLPSQSMPGTRRNSDEDHDDFDNDDFTPLSPVSRKNNRMSMPVTSLDYRSRTDLPDLASVLGHIDTAGYLFGEDDKERNPAASPPDQKAYFQMSNTKDEFPILVRRDGAGNVTHDQYESGNGNVETTPTKNMANNRRSVDFNFSPMNTENKRASFTSLTNPINGSMPKLNQSYSASEIPTLKNGGNGVNGVNGTNGFKSHAEQHLHKHNASLGRIPPNAANRHSRELSSGFKDQEYRTAQHSGLHASAAPFGPAMTSPSINNVSSTVGSPTMSQYSATSGVSNAPYYGYGMSMMNGGMNGMNGMNGLNSAMNAMSLGHGHPLGGPSGYGPGPGPNGVYGQMPFYNPYATYGPSGRVQDSQARVIQSRRLQNDANRFMNYDLKTMPRQEIYTLCKDQHGCRFLQKKLEDRNLEHIQIIFEETNPHVVELMTDPFGNYLCQKLLEFCNDEQRNILVRNASPAMVSIALNQHGTRALQKMIEYISTEEQTQTIIQALSGQVVDLIQDLNGNHVIQKCLNHLKPVEAQFIFDAVGEHCVTVGTHRHGCCVLQRCIDHAAGYQKIDLVRRITQNAFNLVQDPFGNYVVQYILDLSDPNFTTPMCKSFEGKIAELSKQKFSSNVIEKCIRCANMDAKALMIHELLDLEELEMLMRDQYGNYVIQTALEFAPGELALHLIEAMRPILPSIRATPYGRRIMAKVQEREGRLAAYTGRTISGQTSPQASESSGYHATNGSNSNYQSASSSSGYQTPIYTATANYGANIVSPQPHRQAHRLSNPALPHHLQTPVQHPAYQYGVTNGNGNGNSMGNFF